MVRCYVGKCNRPRAWMPDMRIPAEQAKAATQHLKRSDPVMRELVGRVGSFQLRLERNRFWMLVRSIISQHLSTAAARTIRGRVQALVGPGEIVPDAFRRLAPYQLRSAGLSAQKVTFVSDLT